MRQLNVAVVFIVKEGIYFLQLRDKDPHKGAAGLIGCFGGKIEPGEDALHAAHRELQEETSLRILSSRLMPLGAITVVSDYKLETMNVHITAFLLELESNEAITAAEGEIIELSKRKALALAEKLTPGTLACFKALIKET